jgi:DNA-binding XRE family transcriptional regulator
VPLTGASPFVRRRWLGQQIRNLRREHDLSSANLASILGFPRQQLSALENGHLGPDIDLVSGICDFLQVGPRRREDLMAAATDGWAPGWWHADTARMGRRQARYADLESGTLSITEYALALVPGLLQTPAFTDARMRSIPSPLDDQFDPAVAVRARTRRQEMLLSKAGPTYELVLDEFAVRRCAAEPYVVGEQLRHIVAVCTAHPKVVVRILPINATIAGHSAPRSAYSIYRYRDGHRTLAVAVDTLTTDFVFTESADVDAYCRLHSRLRAASLTPEASLGMLTEIAHHLCPAEGRV